MATAVVVLGAMLTWTVLLTTSDQPAQAATRPNVLLILTDDQHVQSLDELAVTMPNLVAHMRANGRNYTRAFTPNPNCCPARAALMSGRYDHNNGVTDQDSGAKLDGRTTMARYLQRAGYDTAITGKYLNRLWPTVPAGFNRYSLISGGYRNFKTYVNGLEATNTTDYNTIWSGRQMRGYLDRMLANPAQPWMLEWATTAPHTYDLTTMVEPRYATMPVPACAKPGEPDKSDKPPYLRWFNYGTPTVNGICTKQQRTLKSVDDQLKIVLDRLRATNQLANTMIVFTSDNGHLWGEHNALRKWVPYQPSVAVPLMISFPGRIAPGSDGRPVSLVDLLPTVLQAAGVAPDPALPPPDGRSLLAPPTAGRPVLGEFWYDRFNQVQPEIPGWASINTGRWKYIETYGTTDATTVRFRELYDLQADPGELTNRVVVGGYPGDAPSLDSWHTRLQQLRTCRGATCP